MRALLDVNVLIALHDRDHVHHERAALWFETNIEHGWASCPLTQNGCLRIMSQAQYSSPWPAWCRCCAAPPKPLFTTSGQTS